jgi:hypothetical protein
MSRLLVAAWLVCAACSDAKTDSFVSRLVPASRCGFPFDEKTPREGTAKVVSALVHCRDADGCGEDRPVMRGVSLSVGLQLGALVSDHASVLAKDSSLLTVSGFSLERDPCSGEPVALGSLQFSFPGEAELLVREDGAVLDSFRFHVRDAAVVQLAVSSDSGMFSEVTTGTITLAQGAVLALRARAYDASGELLITQGQGVYWLDDDSVAELGAHGEPSAEGGEVQLTAMAVGTTTLHVLVSNVSRSFELRVR